MAVIITICILIIIAYIFDLSSSKTKIPSVILLLLLGWIMKELTHYLKINVPDLSQALPILGTIGLILIVLEGSLELELNRSKAKVLGKSSLMALLPMLIMSVGLAFLFRAFGEPNLKYNLENIIPLCVISSAIAIPSVRTLSKQNREFVIYESSLSDIIGVLLFNFVALNETFGVITFLHFGLQLLIIIGVSLVATIGLAFMLNKIEHHIKFVPIILIIILIYAISKIYHLPGLVFILIFGLIIGNLDELKNIKWIEKLHSGELNQEVEKFKDLTIEGAFLVRSVFFILFGYLINTAELLNTDTLIWSLCITAGIFILRSIHLLLFRLPIFPLLFISPRGLITILLFLSIDPSHSISLVNNSLVIQIIILTAFVMMIGLITNKSVPGTEK